MMTRVCEEEYCDRVHHARGMCRMHYKRQDPRHKEYAKEWFAKNPERTKELSRQWTENNREKSRESHRKYYASNKHKYEKYWTERRARLAGVKSEPWDRIEIAERDGWVCQICFQPIENMPKEKYRDSMYLNIDHIVAISKGGSDAPDNLQATHSVCNKSKWVKTLD